MSNTEVEVTKRYYPRLSEIFSADNLPQIFSFIKRSLELVTSSVFYKNLQKTKSEKGDSASYNLDILFRERLELDLIQGIKLVFNPDQVDTVSVLPVSLSYQWEVLRYINSFKSGNFSGSAKELMELGMQIFNVKERQILARAIDEFVLADTGQTKFQKVVADVNSFYGISLALSDDSSQNLDSLFSLLKSDTGLPGSTIEIVFDVYLQDEENSVTISNLETLFRRFAPSGLESVAKRVLTPKVNCTFKLSAALEFPRTMLMPVYDENGESLLSPGINGDPFEVIPEDEGGFPRVQINVGEAAFKLDSENGLGYSADLTFATNGPAKIANSPLVIDIRKIKVDLSRSKNFNTFYEDSIPNDFVGVYIEEASIYFTSGLTTDDLNSTARFRMENMLIGTGGITGKIGMFAKVGQFGKSFIKMKAGENFALSLDNFELEFFQNTIVQSNISGKLTLPGFKKKEAGAYTEDPVELDINVFIGNNGDFRISAQPVEDMSFYIEKVAKITVHSLAIGEENDKFYADIAGEIDFTELAANLPNISTDMPTNIPIRKLRVWEDGKMEFDGGMVHLPRAVTVSIGESQLIVKSLLFSSTELYHNNGTVDQKRAYNVIGFDGTLDVSPGGIDMQGNGIKIYYSTDNLADADPELNRPAHIFIRLEKLDIVIAIPEGASKGNAEFYLHGELAIKNKEGATEVEGYSGSIDFSIKKLDMAGQASMEYAPRVPRWYIDAQVDISKGIEVGSTGLAIYGFKGLAGKGKRFNKAEEETWWQFYKKPTKGINLSKFEDEKGFALGLGVSLASIVSDGKPFSSIVTLVLGLPDVVMLNGRASFMKERVTFNEDQDPPFSVLLSVDSKAIQAGLGVNSEFGKFVKVYGSAEMAYFWNDANAWYVNIGKDQPESDRIKARIKDEFDAYAYLMLSASGVKFGAGAKWQFGSKEGKTVGFGVKAYLDLYGRWSFKPVQIGGGIAMGGEAWVQVSKFKLAFLLAAYLQMESSKPKQIKGGVDVKLELPKPLKSKGLHLEFNWIDDTERDTSLLNILEENPELTRPGQARNMTSHEVISLGAMNEEYSSSSEYPVIPIDSFVDITFQNSPSLNLTDPDSIVIGGQVTAVDSSLLIPPMKGISEQVRHEFEINGVKIEAYNGSTWETYNIFEASDVIKEIPEIATALSGNANYLKTLPQAYWQLNASGKNTTLRLMSTNMFSYLNEAREGSIVLERLGYEGGVVFCEQSKIAEGSIDWDNETVGTTYTANQYYNKDGVRVMVLSKDGAVNELDLYSLNNGLEFTETDGLEIVFGTPQLVVKPKLKVTSGDYLHVEYIGKEVDGYDHNSFPIEKYISLRTDKLSSSQTASYAGYSDDEAPVYKVRITYYKTGMLNADHDEDLRIGYSTVPDTYYNAANGLIVIDDLMILGRAFESADVQDIVTNGYSGGNVIAHWELNGNGNDASGNSHNGTATNSPISFPGMNGSTANAYHLGRCGLYSSAASRYFAVSHSSELSVGKENFSIMAWIKIPTNSSQQALFKDAWYMGQKTIVSKMKKTDGGYQFYTETYKDFASQKLKTNLCFEYKTDSGIGQYIPKFTAECNELIDGEWHHVAVIRTFGYDAISGTDTNVIDLYVDGQWLERKAIGIPVTGSSDKAAIVQLSYLDQESHLKNLRIPSQSTLNSMNNKMKDGLNKSVQPIWRPNTAYRVLISGNEKVDGSDNLVDYTLHFRTEGATGYYTKESVDLDDDKFKLGRIQAYIDFDRSHPNANGQINESKPLYYEQSALNLFYKAPYMNLMFSEWPAYEGLSATEYKLKVQVMDSRTGENVSSEVEPDWTYKDETVETQDIRMINNLIQNGPNCWGDSGLMKRKTATAAYVLPHLLPANLYTATYFSVNPIADPETEVEVHKHVFQTSRYANFTEHLSSFRYSRPETINVLQLTENFNSGSGSFSASGDSSLSMSGMVLLESSHNPAGRFTFSTIYGVPYEIVSDLKGYSYNFGGKTDFYCKVDSYPLYSGNLMNSDREPQQLVYRFYSEKTGDTNVEFGMKNNKIGTLQHFVLDAMKVRIPVFNEVLINKTFTDGDLGSFIGLDGSSVSNVGDALHVEDINAPKAGIYFDTLEGVTYTITFDVLSVSSNGGGSQDLFCAVSGMLAESLDVSGSFPQTLTCDFTANSTGTKLLEIYFDSATTLGTTENFEIDNFKIEHSVATAFDLIGTDFSSGPGGLGASILSHFEPEGVLYSESSSGVPGVEVPLSLESDSKYSLSFKVPAQSYNEGELKIRLQAGTLFDVELEAGTGSEISYDFVTTDAEEVDLKISLKDASSAELEYLMIDDFSLSYSKTADVEIESLHRKTIELDSGNLEAFTNILNDSEEQDAAWLAAMPLKYDRLISAPLGAFQACERLEIHQFINQADDDALLGLIMRSPEPLFFPSLGEDDLADSLEVTCELPEGAGTVSDFKLVYSKDRSSVFITSSSMDIPRGEYHFNFKYLTYNGAAYAIANPSTDQYELVVNII